jgi:hypothetical protein
MRPPYFRHFGRPNPHWFPPKPKVGLVQVFEFFRVKAEWERAIEEFLLVGAHFRSLCSRTRRPTSVVRYLCLELRGLSGIVISSQPAPRSGSK